MKFGKNIDQQSSRTSFFQQKGKKKKKKENIRDSFDEKSTLLFFQFYFTENMCTRVSR